MCIYVYAFISGSLEQRPETRERTKPTVMLDMLYGELCHDFKILPEGT